MPRLARAWYRFVSAASIACVAMVTACGSVPAPRSVPGVCPSVSPTAKRLPGEDWRVTLETIVRDRNGTLVCMQVICPHVSSELSETQAIDACQQSVAG